MNLQFIERGRYRNYDQDIKRQIVESGNLNLFPELNIPRTTALYWIRSAKQIYRMKSSDRVLLYRIKNLEKKLERERAKSRILIEYLKLFEHKCLRKKFKVKKRSMLLDVIEKYKNVIGLYSCLDIIKMNRGQYRRWKDRLFLCKLTNNKECALTRANQLTYHEQTMLKKLFVSSRFAHMSVRALHYYAIRNNLLICSMETWYKYIHRFNLKRPGSVKEDKIYKIGVRANRVDQIWHIDVTQIKMIGGKKIYLQTIMDNYSRYVVSWQLLERVSAVKTRKTIMNAVDSLKKRPEGLMMDGGTENVNKCVRRLLVHKRVKRVISKVDVHWSNSIIEAFFRSLKQNYLNKHLLRNYDDVKRKLEFYFKEHNYTISHNAFNGATPAEIYKRKWCKEKEEGLKELLKKASQQRVSVNSARICCSIL